jgi:phage shock protein C
MTQMPSYKQLQRSRTDKYIGGVCGGAARYLGVDPVAVRVAVVLLAFVSGGLGVVGYLVAWLLMPEEPASPTPAYPAAGYPAAPDYPGYPGYGAAPESTPPASAAPSAAPTGTAAPTGSTTPGGQTDPSHQPPAA